MKLFWKITSKQNYVKINVQTTKIFDIRKTYQKVISKHPRFYAFQKTHQIKHVQVALIFHPSKIVLKNTIKNSSKLDWKKYIEMRSILSWTKHVEKKLKKRWKSDILLIKIMWNKVRESAFVCFLIEITWKKVS